MQYGEEKKKKLIVYQHLPDENYINSVYTETFPSRTAVSSYTCRSALTGKEKVTWEVNKV